MPLEYYVFELKAGAKIPHGSSLSLDEANTIAVQARIKTSNPVQVEPQWIPENQIETESEIEPITAQELYREVHGTADNFDAQNYRTRLLYQLIAETANNLLHEYQNGVIIGGSVEGVR